MIRRYNESLLAEYLSEFPAVALIGPRQVGKTTLALETADRYRSIYLDLESEADRIKLSDPVLYLAKHPDELLILDEVHRLPNLLSGAERAYRSTSATRKAERIILAARVCFY